MTKQKKNETPVVSILNMKGGVGKTTISAHVLRELYLSHRKNVLVIDLDPQFNLTQTLFKEAEYEGLKSSKKTVLSIFEDPVTYSLYATAEKKQLPPSPRDIVVSMKNARWPDGGTARLDLAPGDFSLVQYTLMREKSVLEFSRDRFSQFIESAKNEYDLIFIDCNPSSSFLTLCALGVSSHLLIPVRPDRYSMLGLRLLDEFVKGQDSIKEKPKKVIVLNGVQQNGYDPSVENELRSDPVYGKITLSTSLYDTNLLKARTSYTGFATDRRVAYSKALKARIGALTNEIVVALEVK